MGTSYIDIVQHKINVTWLSACLLIDTLTQGVYNNNNINNNIKNVRGAISKKLVHSAYMGVKMLKDLLYIKSQQLSKQQSLSIIYI